MKPKLTTNFSSYTNSRLIALGLNIEVEMTENEDLFTTEIIAMKTALNLQTLEFQALVLAAHSKVTDALNLRNNYRPLYIHSLSELAIRVNSNYKDDVRMLDLSGFGVLKYEKPYELENIKKVTLSDGKHAHTIKVKIDGAKGYRFIEIRYTLDDSLPIDQWHKKTIGKLSVELGPFPVKSMLTVSVIAIGRDGVEKFSPQRFLAVQ